MKSQFWTVVALGLTAVALVAVIIATPTLESPRDRLFRQIDEKVAQAGRILASYEPIGVQLNFNLEATDPIDLPSDQWQDIQNYVDQESIVSDMLREQSRRILPLDAEYRRYRGQPGPLGAIGTSAESYERIQGTLTVNERKLVDALRIVQQAVRMSEGEHRGAEHPGATRLETILCYHQAEMFGNKAALSAGRAMQEAMLADRYAARSKALAVAIELLEQELEGGPLTVNDQEDEPADRRVLRSIEENISELETDKAQTADMMAVTHGQADRLRAEIAELEGRIAEAQERAGTAQRTMLELEQAPHPGRDAAAVERFVEDYRQASQRHRQAAREEAILREGGLRGARVDAPDFEEVDTAPIVPAEPGEPIEPIRGLLALENDLEATLERLTNLEGVHAAIEQQIRELNFQKDSVAQRLTESEQQRAESIAQTAESAARIVDAIAASDRLWSEALSIAEDQGRPAAARAQQAIRRRISEAARLNRELPPDSPNPRLSMMAADGPLAGHTQALEGDLMFKVASIQAQRGDILAWYGHLLTRLVEAGVTVDTEQLGEDVTADDVPAWLTDPDAARTASAEAHAAAIEAGRQALAAYEEADAPLSQLWTLRANVGATHFLLGNLTTGDEARQHLYDARVEYTRALRNREDRPEAPTYEAVIAQIDRRLR